MLVLAILLMWTLGLVCVNALIDYEMISSGGRINHVQEAIIRFVVLCLVAWFDPLKFIFCASVFWILFELLLNMFRGKPLLYVGQTAWIDRQIHKIFKDRAEIGLLVIKLVIFFTITIILI